MWRWINQWQEGRGEAARARMLAERAAWADARDMVDRLGGVMAYASARNHARAERLDGVGEDLFPPGHWGRVRIAIKKLIGDW